MLYKFSPAACRPSHDEAGVAVPGKYSGHVVIKMPTNLERMTKLKSGVPIDGDDPSKAVQDPAWIADMLERAKGFVVEIAIVRTSDGARFTKWEELDYVNDFLWGVQMDICGKLAGQAKYVPNEDGLIVEESHLGNLPTASGSSSPSSGEAAASAIGTPKPTTGGTSTRARRRSTSTVNGPTGDGASASAAPAI